MLTKQQNANNQNSPIPQFLLDILEEVRTWPFLKYPWRNKIDSQIQKNQQKLQLSLHSVKRVFKHFLFLENSEHNCFGESR